MWEKMDDLTKLAVKVRIAKGYQEELTCESIKCVYV